MRAIFLPIVAFALPILLLAQNSKPTRTSARSKGRGAPESSNDFYASVEKHLVRIILLILLLFGGFKLIVIEAPRIDPRGKVSVPCRHERAAGHATHRAKHRKRASFNP